MTKNLRNNLKARKRPQKRCFQLTAMGIYSECRVPATKPTIQSLRNCNVSAPDLACRTGIHLRQAGLRYKGNPAQRSGRQRRSRRIGQRRLTVAPSINELSDHVCASGIPLGAGSGRVFISFPPRVPCPALGKLGASESCNHGAKVMGEPQEPWPETPAEPCPECGGMAPICNTTGAGKEIIEHYYCLDCGVEFEST